MNASPSKDRKAHSLLGWLCIGIGGGIVLIALGIIPVDPASVYAPYSILGLCGVVLVLGGAMILIGEKSRYNSLAAAAMLVCFAVVGGWAALFADPGSIEGGLPFLSKSTNGMLGKIVFGFGALLSAALVVYAFKMFREGK